MKKHEELCDPRYRHMDGRIKENKRCQECESLRARLATMTCLLSACAKNINEIRDEHKAHGHITDGSAVWKIVLEPKVMAALKAAGEVGK